MASIAKSGPEHYADISFFARRLCLADLGKVIKSCFQFLLQEIAPYSKRNFAFFRIVGHKSARMYVGIRGEISKYLIPALEVRECSALDSMFLSTACSCVSNSIGVLTLFLAQVGMASRPKFAATGLVMLGLGAIVLVALVVPILTLGLLFFRMPFNEVAGIVAGACGNPAILAYANKLTPTDRPGHRLRYDLSRQDHPEDPLRGHRPGVFLKPLSLALRSARWR